MNKEKKVLNVLPLILGVLSIAVLAVSYYGAVNAPYRYTDIAVLGPVFAIAGSILSFLNRKSRKNHRILWTCGMFSCVVALLLCAAVLVYLLLVASIVNHSSLL